MLAKGLHAGCMPQIHSEDFQAMAPLRKVWLASVTGRGVTRKACGHNEVRPRTQQPDASLVTDLNASASEQGNSSTQISRFGTFVIIQVRAFRAKLVVEMMQLRIMPFTDVTVFLLTPIPKLRVFDLFRLECRSRQRVGRGEHQPTTQFSDAGLIQNLLFSLQFLGFSLAYPGFDEAAFLFGVWQVHLARGPKQPGVFLRRKLCEEGAVCSGLFQYVQGRAQLFSRIFF